MDEYGVVVEFCPNCRERLPGTLSLQELRRHLDGHCITKANFKKQQNQRKVQPKLPGF